MEINKSFPHSSEIEKAVLTGLLLDNKTFNIINDIKIVSSDFFIHDHSIIFDSILELYNKYQYVDHKILLEYLLKFNYFNEHFIKNFFHELELFLPSIISFEHYCKIIKEKSFLRKLLNFFLEKINDINGNRVVIKEFINSFQKDFTEISNTLYNNEFNENNENIIFSNLKKMEESYNTGKSPGTLTGFYDLDNITSGFHPGEFILLASRPSMGKTALALNIFYNLFKNSKIPVAFFSLEMSLEHILYRLISIDSGINLMNLRNSKITEDEFLKVIQSLNEINNENLFIFDNSCIDINEFVTKIKNVVLKNNIKLVIIDYLQLISFIGNKSDNNKVNETTEISKKLKNLAKELKIPIIALSQLNRSLEARLDKRPNMSDLRESGALEQDADLVIFLFREEYYLRNNISKEKIGLSEVIISKNRNGPTGVIFLKYFHELTKFVNLVT